MLYILQTLTGSTLRLSDTTVPLALPEMVPAFSSDVTLRFCRISGDESGSYDWDGGVGEDNV